MAKKKAEEEAKKKAEEEPVDWVERVARGIEGGYGEGILVSGQDLVEQTKIRIPWSPSLDLIFSGGIEEGSWVGITGPPKMGKTCAALTLAASAQRPEYGSRPVYYAKVEGRLSTEHLRGIKGLDLSPGRFNVIQSRKGKILSAQDFLRILSSILTDIPQAFVIVDSVSSLSEEKELVQGIGTETRGGAAKLFAQFSRTMGQVVPVNDAIVVSITHRIANTSGYGPAQFEKGPNSLMYQKDYALRVTKKEAWEAGGKQVGLKVAWSCETSKNGPPFMKLDGYLRFGVGLDSTYEVLSLGCTAGLVQAAGSWFSFVFVPEKPKFQGMEKAYQALKENEGWFTELSRQVSEAVGLVGYSSD